MQLSLNSIINTNVLDIDKKRPDYIYLKYSIYKESIAEIRNSQKYDKVSKHAQQIFNETGLLFCIRNLNRSIHIHATFSSQIYHNYNVKT